MKALRHLAICVTIIVGFAFVPGALIGLAVQSWGPVAFTGCCGVIFSLIVFGSTVGEEASFRRNDDLGDH